MLVQRERERIEAGYTLWHMTPLTYIYMSVLAVVGLHRERGRQTEREGEREREQMEVCYTLCNMTSLRHVYVGCCVFVHTERHRERETDRETDRQTDRANGSSLSFVQHDVSNTYMPVLAVVCVCAERERDRQSEWKLTILCAT